MLPFTDSKCVCHLVTCIHIPVAVFSCDLELLFMTLTFKLNLNSFGKNQQIKHQG